MDVLVRFLFDTVHTFRIHLAIVLTQKVQWFLERGAAPLFKAFLEKDQDTPESQPDFREFFYLRNHSLIPVLDLNENTSLKKALKMMSSFETSSTGVTVVTI